MQRERANAFKLIVIQAALVILVSILFLLSSFKSAYSVFLGGMVCVIPSIYFAHQLFKYVGARMAKHAVRAFYLGEVIKLFLVGFLSVLVFKFVAIIPMSYFIGFIVAQIAFWIAPNVLLARQARLSGGAA